MALDDKVGLLTNFRNWLLKTKIGNAIVYGVITPAGFSYIIGCGGDKEGNGITDGDGGNGHVGNGLNNNQWRLQDGKTIATLVFPKDADDAQPQTANADFSDGEKIEGNYKPLPFKTAVVGAGHKHDKNKNGTVSIIDLEILVEENSDAQHNLRFSKEELKEIFAEIGYRESVVPFAADSGIEAKGQILLRVNPDVAKLDGIDGIVVNADGNGIKQDAKYSRNDIQPSRHGDYLSMIEERYNGQQVRLAVTVTGNDGKPYKIVSEPIDFRVAMQYANVWLADLQKDTNGDYRFEVNIPQNPGEVFAYVITQDRDDLRFRLIDSDTILRAGNSIPQDKIDGKRLYRIDRTNKLQGRINIRFKDEIGKSDRVVYSNYSGFKLPK